MLFYFFYSVFGLAVLLIWTVPTAERNFIAEAFTETVMLIFTLGLAILIITDRPTMDFVRTRKWLARWFIIGTVVAVIVSAQLLPHAIGRTAGIIQGNPYRIERYFPSINITASKPLWSSYITWVELGGMYESEDRLVLIMENEDGLFVKKIIQEEVSESFTIKEVSETYYIPRSNVEGLSVRYAG